MTRVPVRHRGAHYLHMRRPGRRGPVVARRDTFEFPWPTNPVCAALGHHPVPVLLPLRDVDIVACGRCERRPLWWGTLADAKVHAHPGLARTDYYRREQWVGFRSFHAYLAHVTAGGRIAWPGDPRVEGRREDDGQLVVETVAVDTFFRAGRSPRGVSASLALSDGAGLRPAFEAHVTAGPLTVKVSTVLAGRRLARRLMPPAETRRVAAGARLGPAHLGNPVRGAVAYLELWVDDMTPAGGLPWWRFTYARPFTRRPAREPVEAAA